MDLFPRGPPKVKASSLAKGERPVHLGATAEDVGGYAIIAGDPGRIPAIAALFEDPREVSTARGFAIWTGTLFGVKVSAVSHGIGSPSAAIVMEELAQLGVHTVIRCGTCGGLQRFVRPGDVIVSTSCIRDEGTSRSYCPIEFPAVAEPAVVVASLTAAKRLGVHTHVGVTHCKDAFYSELPGYTVVEKSNSERWKAFEDGGAIATEMEASALYIVGHLRHMRTGVVLACVGTTVGEEGEPFIADAATIALAREGAIRVTVEALRVIVAHDNDIALPVPERVDIAAAAAAAVAAAGGGGKGFH